MTKRIKFCEVEVNVCEKPGIYEIYTNTGIPLKVGIGKNLRRRLLQHRASRQSCLKLKPGGRWCIPSDVHSKGSILAKYLYYDKSIAPKYYLKSEEGRRDFLKEECNIIFEITKNRADARTREKCKERSILFRYKDGVVKL